MKNLKEHLKNDSGDGYIFFILLLLVALLFFGGIYNLIETNISMKNLRTEIDQTAEDVYADIKEIHYGNLTAGATGFTGVRLSDKEIAELFAEKLHADITDETIPVLTRGRPDRLEFSITNLSALYVDRVKARNPEMGSLGDLNHDDYVNNDDLNLFKEYLTNPGTDIDTGDYDLNRDGIITAKDGTILTALIDYYKQFDGDVKTDTSTALLLLMLDITVPTRFGTFTFGDSTDTYFYINTLSVKQA